MLKLQPQPEWLRVYTRSLQGGQGYSSVLEGEHFAVIKEPGSTSYTGRAFNQYKYYQTVYILIEKGKDFWRTKSKEIWKGRLTKEGRKVIEAALAEAEKGVV